jgi:hypothetical protein
LEGRLCIVFNHRHFDLEPDEKLVERENIATPWLPDGAPEYITNPIIGPTWTFIDGDLLLYEYVYCGDSAEEHLQPPSAFAHELHAMLIAHNVIHHRADHTTERITWRVLTRFY